MGRKPEDFISAIDKILPVIKEMTYDDDSSRNRGHFGGGRSRDVRNGLVV